MSLRRKSSVTSLLGRANLKKIKKLKNGSSKGTSGGISNDGKQVRVTVWPEWSENDVNNEKWEMTSKIKEKDKSKSPQMTLNLFDDPDGRLRLPAYMKVAKWRRASDYFTKTPVVVDNDSGIHDFDIFSPNEHLFVSETIRWIICQINTLWIISEKMSSGDVDNQTHDTTFVNSNGLYHTWKFWEHIYSLNKVGKGLPQYNPTGKYIVKLFWMGEWRKIFVDDTLPFDENDQLLLPVTRLNNELWPIILSKALLKIASLSYGFPSNDTEFGDFSVIHALTGWIPQMKIVTKDHQNQIWKHLGDLLPHWTFSEGEKSFVSLETNILSPENQEFSHDKNESKETNARDKKDKKDSKDNKGKDKKEKEKEKSKPVILEGKPTFENPETVIFASYRSNFPKLNILTVANMADHSEALRKIGLTQTYSHPVLLNYYRDCPLVKPKTPEFVPAWKLIRPMVKPGIPQFKDCVLHDLHTRDKNKDYIDNLQMIQIQTPFLNYKISNRAFPSTYSRESKGLITDIAEDVCEKEHETFSSNTQNLVDSNVEKEMVLVETTKKSITAKSNYIDPKLPKQSLIDDDILNESFENRNVKRSDDVEEKLKKSWINIETFCECFQVLYIYHKPETYRNSETIMDNKQANIDQKEPIYLFVDHVESSEIIFCLSSFCKWLSPIENPIVVDNSNSPLISNMKDAVVSNETNFIENDADLPNQNSLHLCSFIAENHNWKLFKIGNIFKRARTNGTKAISLKFPPGRHCIRILIECKNGFHCKVISQNQFYLKNEDSIMSFFTEEPKRIKDFSLNIILSFNKIIENFSNIEERRIAEKSFIDIVLPFNERKLTYMTSKITQIFGQSFLKVINQLNREIISQDMIFAIRALTLFFESNNFIINFQQKPTFSSNRNSAKAIPVASTKIDSRKQSSTKSIVNQDNKEDRKFEIISKEYMEEDIVKVQKYFKGLHVRKVLKARDPQSNNHGRVTTELKKLLTVIEQNSLKYGMSILCDITDKYPQIFKYYAFENDKLNHIILQEYSGTCNSQSGSGFEILFRETFFLNKQKSEINLIIKLTCTSLKCTLMLINNDSGQSFSDSVMKRLHLPNLTQNTKGYTILSFVKEVEPIINWKLKLIGDGNDILPQSSKQELCSDFSVTKMRDYYIPNRHGLLFHQLTKVKNDHQTTIYIKLSNPSVPFRLSIFNYEDEVYSVEGVGEALVPSFIFQRDDISDNKSARSPSRTSAKSKKAKDKNSARNSRTNSSSSGDENKINKYSIQIFLDNETWKLTEANEVFVEILRHARKKEMAEHKVWNENQIKSTQNIDPSKKESNQKLQSKGKGKEKGLDNTKVTKGNDKVGSKALNADATTSRPNSNSFESDKAHWTFYLISDSALEDNISISRNNAKYEDLLATKKLWEEMDSLRFEKGKQIQRNFIEANAVDDNKYTFDQNLHVSLRPIDISIFYRNINVLGDSEIDFESKRMKNVEIFRQQQLDWNTWCKNERNERNKKIGNNINEYRKLQETVNSHRTYYYKVRENVRKSISNSIRNT